MSYMYNDENNKLGTTNNGTQDKEKIEKYSNKTIINLQEKYANNEKENNF